MNKVYVLAPLAGLIAFGGVYWKYEQAYTARLAVQRDAAELKRREKEAAQEVAHARASEAATQQVARRQLERAEKERAEEQQRHLRAELEEARNAAGDRTRRLRPEIERLHTEVNTATAAIARSEKRARELRTEQEFLFEYVRQAESSRSALYELLEKIEVAERHAPTNARPPNRSLSKS